MTKQLINPKFIAALTTLSALTGIVATAGAANAASLTYSDTFELATTDIRDEILSIRQFDASRGTLTSVKIKFDGQLLGDASFENRDAQNQRMTFDLSGNLKLTGPAFLSNPLFNESVSAADSLDATAFDGVIDFGGTSGGSFTGLTAFASGESIYTDQSILNAFMGNGNLDFLFTALGTSRVSGSGNIVSQINTQASAVVSVVYEYDKAQEIPEPSAMIGLGLVAGAGWLSRKRNTFSS